jgi:hypothetical protein
MVNQPVPEDVSEAIAAGRKIDAIKLLRMQWGIGLAEAKEIVDNASARGVRSGGTGDYRIEHRHKEDKGIMRLVVVMAALAAVIGLYYFLA